MKTRGVYNGLVLACMLAPIFVVVIVSVNPGNYLAFPPNGISFRWYKDALTHGPFIDSLLFSLQIAAITAAIGLAICLPAAFYLTRVKGGAFWATTRLTSLVPLTVPEIVVALGILISVNNIYPIGTGGWSVVFGHVIFCIPYGIQVISAGLASMGRDVEDAARTLGATPVRTFLRVIVREIAPSTLGAGVFIFIFSFDNVNISIFLTAPGQVPLPVQMFQYLEFRSDPTVAAMSTVLIGGGLVALLIIMVAGGVARQVGVRK